MDLKPRFQQFANEWLTNGNNATEAYSKVSPKVIRNVARVEGAKYLLKPAIKKYISAKIAKQTSKTEITFEWVANTLKKMIETEDVRYHVPAMQELNKMFGFHAAIKQELAGKDGKAIQISWKE